jgi:catechol 2,3-dioxygenase-like lactoylglutathione lyase family enzyme
MVLRTMRNKMSLVIAQAMRAPGAPVSRFNERTRTNLPVDDRDDGFWEGDAMINHLSIQVRDLAASADFYDTVLAPLGASRVLDFGDAIAYGTDSPEFWLGAVSTEGEAREMHLAFTAPDRAAVVAFHDAAVAKGAEVLHAPRLWPEYDASYYGAFVRDPDGNNVEAVCEAPE